MHSALQPKGRTAQLGGDSGNSFREKGWRAKTLNDRFAREVKNKNNKVFQLCGEQEKEVGPLHGDDGDTPMSGIEKQELLNMCFLSVFTQETCTVFNPISNNQRITE